MNETTITNISLSEESKEKLESATKADILSVIESVFSHGNLTKR